MESTLDSERYQFRQREQLLEGCIEDLKGNSQKRYHNLLAQFDRYKRYVAIELAVSQKIASLAKSEQSSYINKIKELKAILRVPRLYDQY